MHYIGNIPPLENLFICCCLILTVADYKICQVVLRFARGFREKG